MHELMFQAGVKGMSELRSLIPCNIYISRAKSPRFDRISLGTYIFFPRSEIQHSVFPAFRAYLNTSIGMCVVYFK